MVEKYLGSVKSYNRKENWVDNKVRGPKGRTEKVIELDLTTPKATVITSFSKEMKTSIHDNLCLNILRGVLDQRYMTNIREKEGGTYGVAVQPSSSKEPYESYSMSMSFDCDPDKAEHLKSLIYAEIDKLMKEGPTQEEIDKVTTILKKNNEQSKPHNAYWMNAIQTYYLRGIDVTDPKNFDNIIDKITTKDVKKFTQKLFKGADVVDMIFQPKSK